MTTRRKEDDTVGTTHNRYRVWNTACTPDARTTDRSDECMKNLADTAGVNTDTLLRLGIVKPDGRNKRNQSS